MNLLITCARYLESETEEEIRHILNEIGDPEPIIIITNMSGILTVKTVVNPTAVVERFKEKMSDEPWSIRYCLRVIPIQKVTRTEITSIEEEVKKMIQLMVDNESYRITIEKRNSDISSQELITRIARNIKNRVSLEHPDKILLIEILENITGISIIKTSEILSVEKFKRDSSE